MAKAPKVLYKQVEIIPISRNQKENKQLRIMLMCLFIFVTMLAIVSIDKRLQLPFLMIPVGMLSCVLSFTFSILECGRPRSLKLYKDLVNIHYSANSKEVRHLWFDKLSLYVISNDADKYICFSNKELSADDLRRASSLDCCDGELVQYDILRITYSEIVLDKICGYYGITPVHWVPPENLS